LLILTRKKGQSIILNNNIEIIITAVEGDQVKVGINAPQEVNILRKEVYEAVQESNKEAVQTMASLEVLKKLSNSKKKNNFF
jgi:carbon storage regulator